MKARVLKIGIIQQNTKKRDIKGNFEKSKKLIKKAAKKGAQIICTPECMLDGYAFDDAEFQAHPERFCLPLTHPIIKQYENLAKNTNTHLIIGLSLSENDQKEYFRNAVIIFSPLGKIIGQYNKTHSTYGNLEANFYKHGTDFPVFEIEIEKQSIKIGIMICYDRQMPEPARILSVRGAEIIFNPVATGNFRRSWNKHLLQTRAYENKCFVVSTNHAWPRINGRSLIANPNGKIISRCPPWETVKVKSIKISEITNHRKQIKTRRPSIYQGLLEP